MASLYTREEIDAFVAGNLRIVGERSINNAAAIRENFADAIEQLPPEQQSLLIEKRRGNITGDHDAVQSMYSGNDFSNVNGFFQPGHLGGEFGHAQDPIVWHNQARGNEGIITARHEQGHRADRQVGGETYWSDSNERWSSALQNEIQHQSRMVVAPSDARNPGQWISRQIKKLTTGHDPNSPLYEGARELPSHLDLYEDISAHPREAMAEISNHHMSLYADHGGNEARVDELMSQKYPELWPVYRDDYLPAVNEYANNLQAQREQSIDKYMTQAEALAEAGEQSFNEATVRQQAGVLAAEGAIAAETRSMERTVNIYNDPVTKFVYAQRDLAESRYYLETPHSSRRETPFTFDEEAVEAEANRILLEEGKAALVENVQALRAEDKALGRFEMAQNTLAERVSNALGDEKTAYKSDAEVLAKFDALKAAGGLDAVAADMDRSNVPGRGFSQYLQAREDIEAARWQIEYPSDVRRQANPFIFDREAVVVDALNIAESSNERDALSSAAKEMNREVRLLENFSDEYKEQRYQVAVEGNVSIRRPDVESFKSEQLTSANGQIQGMLNPALANSFANISEILTQFDYIGGGPGPHTHHQQNGFTLRDHLGSAIGRMLDDGGLNNEHFGGQESWKRLRQEFRDLAGDDPKLMQAFREFEVDLFEQAQTTHRRVTPLAPSANANPSVEGDQLLSDFDKLKELGGLDAISDATRQLRRGEALTFENQPPVSTELPNTSADTGAERVVNAPNIVGSSAGVGLGLYGLASRGDQVESDLEAGGIQALASSAGTAADVADVAIGGAGLLDDAGKALSGASGIASKAAIPLAVVSATGEAIAGIAAGDAERAVKAGVGLGGALAGGQAGATACAVGGPWAAAGCGIIGGIAGGLLGEQAVEGIFNLSSYREEVMQQRWQEGGFEAVEMVIAQTPVGEDARRSISSYKLREVSEAKTELFKLLETPAELREENHQEAVENATEKLLQSAVSVVDPIITDNHADITLSEVSRKLNSANEMTALVSGRSIEEVINEAQSIGSRIENYEGSNTIQELEIAEPQIDDPLIAQNLGAHDAKYAGDASILAEFSIEDGAGLHPATLESLQSTSSESAEITVNHTPQNSL